MSTDEHQKHPGGRPIGRDEFKPEYCEQVIEWGKLGKSKTWMAATLGVCRATLANWERAHPSFLDALTRAMALSQAWWEDAGQSNLATPGYQQTMWGRNMAARFPKDWRESTHQEITGKDGSPLVPVLNVNVRKTE